METKLDSMGFPIEEKVGDFFNFKEGDTKLRVMTSPIPVRSYFKDGKYTNVDINYHGSEKTSLKGWAWCVLRETGELKIVKFPYSVIKAVQGFMLDEEYAFEGFPMPYDLTITATGEGMERRYTVLASRKNTPVTEEEKEALAKKTPIQDIIGKIQDKAEGKTPVKKGGDYPEYDGEPPF